MRKYLALALLLILFLLCSCAGAQFEQSEYEQRFLNKPMTVSEINGDTAILLTDYWAIEYLVDSEGLEVGQRRYFMLSVHPCYNCRTFRATIHGHFRLDQKKEYRRELHKRHL